MLPLVAALDTDSIRLLEFAIIVGVPALIWLLPPVRRFVPAAVVFMLFGVLLGPSVLGKINPALFTGLFPVDAKGAFNTLNEVKFLGFIAVTLFGFTTGLHLDLAELKGKGKAYSVLSVSSIAAPFLLGMIAAAGLLAVFPRLAGARATAPLFIFAIGLSAGVTALPVLSAILSELHWIDEPIGKFSLGLATFHDFVLWLMLTILLALTGTGEMMSHGQSTIVVRAFTLTIIYVVVMFVGVRPLLVRAERMATAVDVPEAIKVTVLVCLMFLSALITEAIGIHSLLGAVLFGAIIPRAMAKRLGHMIEPVNMIIFLPFFFASAGLRINVSFADRAVWIMLAVIVLVSVVGQLLGTAFVSARFFHFERKTAFTLASLMQCKGIVEIVVLGLLFDYQILSGVCYAAMILMALTTTGITKPMVMLYTRKRTESLAAPIAPPSMEPIPIIIRQVLA